jgi:hypothetical protein
MQTEECIFCWCSAWLVQWDANSIHGCSQPQGRWATPTPPPPRHSHLQYAWGGKGGGGWQFSTDFALIKSRNLCRKG